MESIELKGGGRMPVLGLGTWQLRGDNCERVVRLALDLGYRHIDTAEMYDNEAEVGAAIAGSRQDRGGLFITTKIWPTHFRATEARRAAEASLRRLRTDYVDLLLMHWPTDAVPMGETLSALLALQGEGKARAIGVSNFPVRLMQEAVETHRAPVACNQVEYHVLLSQRPVLGYARQHGIAVTAYCPLARGRLVDHPELARIGAKYGKSASQVALRWLVQQEGVSAVPKASSERNLRANLDIFDFALDAEDLAALAPLTGATRVVNDAGSPAWDPP